MNTAVLLNSMDYSFEQKYKKILDFQEELWQKLFDIENLQIKVTSPLRVDNNPGCFFWETESRIYFVDFADTTTHRDIFDFTQEYFGFTFKQAVEFLYKLLQDQRNIILKQLKKKKKNGNTKYKISYNSKQFSRKELNYWKQFDINPRLNEFVTNFEIKPLRKFETQYNIVYPDLGFVYEFYNGEYKIYIPYAKKQWKWRSKVSKETVATIHLRDFIKQYAEKLVITKSIKDGLILAKFAPTVVFQSETSFPSWKVLLEEVKIWQFKEVYIIFDRDKTGIKQSNKLKNVLFWKISPEIKQILLPKKDIADMVIYDKNATYNYLKSIL